MPIIPVNNFTNALQNRTSTPKHAPARRLQVLPSVRTLILGGAILNTAACDSAGVNTNSPVSSMLLKELKSANLLEKSQQQVPLQMKYNLNGNDTLVIESFLDAERSNDFNLVYNGTLTQTDGQQPPKATTTTFTYQQDDTLTKTWLMGNDQIQLNMDPTNDVFETSARDASVGFRRDSSSLIEFCTPDGCTRTKFELNGKPLSFLPNLPREFKPKNILKRLT